MTKEIDSQEFHQLTQDWLTDTGHLSNPAKIADHPSFQKIVALGETAIPLILQAYQESEDIGWALALHQITGGIPDLDPADYGVTAKIRDAWVAWGQANGYLPS